ncbi:MAG: hypothetical protein IPK13_24600 [Deltaproteobacteria bacterium]|nr:hypothetical protein [Deltaproteobacteria bacterium]
MTGEQDLEVGVYRLVPAKSSVRVTARAPAHTFQAEGSGLSGMVRVEQEGLTELEVDFPLARLDAKDALKNHELGRFLSFNSAPIARATLRGTRGERLSFSRALPRPAPASGSENLARNASESGYLDGSGEVLIASPTGRMALAKVQFTGRYPAFRASFETSFSALGYSPPKLLFLKVQDRLGVEIKLVVSEDDSGGRGS